MAESIGRLFAILLELLLWVVPIVILIAAWRWAAGTMRELRAVRKQLDAIAAAIERIESGKQQPR